MYHSTELILLSTSAPVINDEESLIGPALPEESNLQRIYENGTALAGRMLVPTGSAFVASNALFGLLMTIMEGYPKAVPAAARVLSRYEMPLVAGPMTLLGSLHAAGSTSLAVPNRLANSTMSGLSVTNFTLPMIMEILTLVIQAIKGESRSADVQISNWAAWPIILACLALGMLQSIQNDFLITNKADPDRIKSALNRFATHPFTQAVSAIIDTASNIHSLTLNSMIAAGANPEANAEFYTRMAITLGAGVAGAVIFARPHRDSRADAIWALKLLSVTALTSLSMSFLNTYYLSPNAVDVLGQSIINEQTALWSTLIALPSLIIMLQLLGLKGPALWQAITNMANELIAYFQPGQYVEEGERFDFDYEDSSDEETAPLNPANSTRYGTGEGLNSAESSYNSSSSSDSEREEPALAEGATSPRSEAMLLIQHSALFLAEPASKPSVDDSLSSNRERSKSL